MSRLNSIAVRLVAGAALWIAAALLAGGFLLSNLFRDSVERGFDDRLQVLLNTLIAVTDVMPDGRVELSRELREPRFQKQYSGWYWQITAIGTAAPEQASHSLSGLQPLRFDHPPLGDRVQRLEIGGPAGQRLAVVALHLSFETLEGLQRSLVFSVAGDRAEIETEVARFNATLAWSLGVLGLVLVMAVLIQVHFGLRPLRRIRGALAEIRAGRAERLEGEFPSEVTPLAEELNGLLDHTAEVLARARTHVGNLAHALKTPLAVLTNEAASASGGLAEAVRRQTAVMRRHVDHHLSRARAAGQSRVLGAGAELRPVLEALARTLQKIHAERGIAVRVEGGAGLGFRGERHDLEEMLGNLIDNACKWARREVRVHTTAEAATGSGGLHLTIIVDDDGPGIAPAERAGLFDRGTRLDEAVPGSGLGLSIVRDMAALYGGEVGLAESSLGGLRVTLTLPGMAAATTEATAAGRRAR
jgi:signal transduction histidine kinase